MIIRSSENPHAFQNRLYARLNAYSLQGLLMDQDANFTAAVEAIQYSYNEDYVMPFTDAELRARILLAELLGIPFFIVRFRNELFSVIKVTFDTNSNSICITPYLQDLIDEQFATWWASLKRMNQRKPLGNGGDPRVRRTVFDSTLERFDLLWGGNIDGFVVNDQFTTINCIIDNISVSGQLDSSYADPARYLTSPKPYHGPRYHTWYPVSKLAITLNVPHALFTIDKNNQYAEHIGMAFIKEVTPAHVLYVNNVAPYMNVIQGEEQIANSFFQIYPQISPPILV